MNNFFKRNKNNNIMDTYFWSDLLSRFLRRGIDRKEMVAALYEAFVTESEGPRQR